MASSRIAIVALAVVCVGGGFALWLESRPNAATPKAAAAPPPDEEPPSEVASPTDISLRPHRESLPLEDEKTEEEILKEIGGEQHEMTVRLADGVPQEVYRVAAPCYSGQGEKANVIVPRFRFTYSDGVASLSEVSIARSDIDDAQLRGCIVTALENLTWRDDGAEDYSEMMDVELSVLGLEKRKRDLLPPDDDDDDD